jgi:hypothetical protein
MLSETGDDAALGEHAQQRGVRPLRSLGDELLTVLLLKMELVCRCGWC